MADIQYPIITIGRQYAAGGRSVAGKVSELLDIPWYDNDFIKKAVEISGLPEKEFQEGEQVTLIHQLLQSMLPVSYSSEGDMVQDAQQRTVLELAKKPCIIIGRCANIILREAKIPTLSVYLYSDFDTRMKRAKELNNNADMDYRTYVSRRDNRRASYYKAYTGFEQKDPRNYDLCLDTGKLGYDKCAEILADLAKGMAK